MTEIELHAIEVCVCTYRRASLLDTLQSLTALNVPKSCTISILVIDNDDTPSAETTVDAFAKCSPFAVTYRHCPKGNISIARNGGLQHASGRYLAFIDDDEVASPDWLVELFGQITQTKADVVLGPVEAVYDDASPNWMRETSMHSTHPVWVNGVIETGYTCNVLIDRHSPAVQSLTFDLDLGQSGGEDTKFFAQVFKNGGQITYADAATVFEDVPDNRLALNWLIKRRFRMGQTHGRLLGRDIGLVRRLRHIAIVSAKIMYCAANMAIRVFDTAKRNQSMLRGMLHLGALTGLVGVKEMRQYGAGFSQAPKR
ncbi:MAG: glycosyltransferase family 2 protein [Sulfitobacter sp.]